MLMNDVDLGRGGKRFHMDKGVDPKIYGFRRCVRHGGTVAACNARWGTSLLHGDLDGGLGDLGWGWKSLKSVGSFAARVGKGAYGIASMPVKAALKVANATAGVMCQGDGPKTGTAASFCAAIKYKDQAKIRSLLPAAVAQAAQNARVQQALVVAQKAQAVRAASGLGSPPSNAQIQHASKAKRANYKSCIYEKVNELNYNQYDAAESCADELRGADLSDSDTNLLASLADADPNALSFALAGVDPSEIGAAVTMSDMLTIAPVAGAALLGFFLLRRG